MRSRASFSASSALRHRRPSPRRLDLAGRDAQRRPQSSVDPVEFRVSLDQGGIAARGDIVDDGARRGLDVGRHLALGGEEGRKSMVKNRRCCGRGERAFLGLASGWFRGARIGSPGPLLNGAAATRRQLLATCRLRRRPGPITTKGNCRANWGYISFQLPNPWVMGPGPPCAIAH